MDKSYPINFKEESVIQLEMLADFLENLTYSKEDLEVKILTLFVNIESLLPNSHIFDYVIKKDLYKNELEEIDKQMWLLKNRLSDIHNDIDDSEWAVSPDTHEGFLFDKIKEKLIINKKLNYGAI